VFNVLNFFFRNNTQIFLLKSLVKVKKYLEPKNEKIESGAQRSKCMNCDTFIALFILTLGNHSLICSPPMRHLLQNFLISGSFGIPSTTP
jgi:hypothetical protein